MKIRSVSTNFGSLPLSHHLPREAVWKMQGSYGEAWQETSIARVPLYPTPKIVGLFLGALPSYSYAEPPFGSGLAAVQKPHSIWSH